MSKTGFGAPNHTQTPNTLFDLLPDMDETELRVTLVIIRETFGWHRPSIELTLAQLQARTGLSKQGVWNGLEKGQARGTIVKTAEGRRRAFALNVKATEDGQSSGPSSVNSVDQSADLESQLSRPTKVNSVDRDGQPSRPSSVNSVDRTDSSGAAPSGNKSEAERKSKESKRKETETGAPKAAVSTPGQDQDSSTGAAHAAGANTPTTPPVQEPTQPTANGRAPNATSSKDGPGAARPVENPVDNFPETPLRPLLVGCFGKKFLTDLVEEDPSRSDWFALPTETFQARKDDAVTTSERGRWKSALITLLDTEAATARRARRPKAAPGALSGQSITETINARIAATRRTE